MTITKKLVLKLLRDKNPSVFTTNEVQELQAAYKARRDEVGIMRLIEEQAPEALFSYAFEIGYLAARGGTGTTDLADELLRDTISKVN